jgi:hypothetical protein
MGVGGEPSKGVNAMAGILLLMLFPLPRLSRSLDKAGNATI